MLLVHPLIRISKYFVAAADAFRKTMLLCCHFCKVRQRTEQQNNDQNMHTTSFVDWQTPSLGLRLDWLQVWSSHATEEQPAGELMLQVAQLTEHGLQFVISFCKERGMYTDQPAIRQSALV